VITLPPVQTVVQTNCYAGNSTPKLKSQAIGVGSDMTLHTRKIVGGFFVVAWLLSVGSIITSLFFAPSSVPSLISAADGFMDKQQQQGTHQDDTGDVLRTTNFTGLHAIVTGLEHSCTTLISKLLFNAPCVIGAFETGYLLAPSPKEITKVQPWYDWHKKNESTTDYYDLTPEDLFAMENAPNFQTMYDILRERSYLFNDLIDEEYCEKPYQLIDKTPRYIDKENFERVLVNTPGVPVIVAQKGFHKLAESWAKRNGTLTRQEYDTTIENVLLMRKKYPHRILIVQEETLMKHPNAVMEVIFRHVGLEWKSEYLQMKGLLRKVSNDSTLTKWVEQYKFIAGKHSDRDNPAEILNAHVNNTFSIQSQSHKTRGVQNKGGALRLQPYSTNTTRQKMVILKRSAASFAEGQRKRRIKGRKQTLE
jgi:hypothetical protein